MAYVINFLTCSYIEVRRRRYFGGAVVCCCYDDCVSGCWCQVHQRDAVGICPRRHRNIPTRVVGVESTRSCENIQQKFCFLEPKQLR